MVDTVDERSAFISQLLGPQLRDQGYLVDARHCYEDAEQGYGRLGLDVYQAHAIRGLAHLDATAGDYEAARRNYKRARAISRRKKDEIGQALALVGLGAVARLTDNYDRAARYLRQAIKKFTEHQETSDGNPITTSEYAAALTELSYIENAHGHLDTAFALLDDAWQVYIKIGAITFQYGLLLAFAAIERDRGNFKAARWHLNAFLRHVNSLNDPNREAEALWELGQLEKATGDPATAIGLFERVIELRRDLGPLGYTRGLLGLADAERLDGRLDTAREHFEEFLRLCLNLEDRDGVAQAHLGLGDVAMAAGDRALATHCWHQSLTIATEIGTHFIIQKTRSRLASVGA